MPTPRSTSNRRGDAPADRAHDQALSSDVPDPAPVRGQPVTSALGVGGPAAGVVLLPGDANLKGIQELAAALWGAGD